MKQIAIIDDDMAIGTMLEEVLTQEGYGVLRAYSGTEALYLLEQHKPDLVLLDLMLPGLSGEELLPKIQGIPVIVLSAKAQVQDKVDLLLGGAADYLTKPFDVRELLARIAVQLRRPSAAGGKLAWANWSWIQIPTRSWWADSRSISPKRNTASCGFCWSIRARW